MAKKKISRERIWVSVAVNLTYPTGKRKAAVAKAQETVSKLSNFIVRCPDGTTVQSLGGIRKRSK